MSSLDLTSAQLDFFSLKNAKQAQTETKVKDKTCSNKDKQTTATAIFHTSSSSSPFPSSSSSSKKSKKHYEESANNHESMSSSSKKSKKHRKSSSSEDEKENEDKNNSDEKNSKKTHSHHHHKHKDKEREKEKEKEHSHSSSSSSSSSETRQKNSFDTLSSSSSSSSATTAHTVSKKIPWENYSETEGKTDIPHLYSESRITRKIDNAKRKHRTSLSLSDWQRYKFFDSFESLRSSYVQMVTNVSLHIRPVSYSLHCVYSNSSSSDSSSSHGKRKQPLCQWLDHIHTKDFSVEKFAKEYEKNYFPVVVEGCADHWLGRRKWTLPALAAGMYRDTKFKIGEDDDGNSIKMKLKYFLQYLSDNKDDSPLYLFDGAFDERSGSKTMLDDYDLPIYFRADLFRYVGEKRRPPYRWFAIGPERSGSSVHIDPLGTSAWNTLIVGKKLWVLFHPEAPKPAVKGEHLKQKGEDNEAITYFARVLPRIMAEEEKKQEGPTLGMRMFIQEAGQTVFVPGGWWHGVLNLEHSVAVTQNFASEHNFPVVWRKTRKSRKHMARRWLNELERNEPQLFKQAQEMDKADNFEWVFNDKKKKDKKKSRDKSRERSREKGKSKMSDSDS